MRRAYWAVHCVTLDCLTCDNLWLHSHTETTCQNTGGRGATTLSLVDHGLRTSLNGREARRLANLSTSLSSTYTCNSRHDPYPTSVRKTQETRGSRDDVASLAPQGAEERW